MSAEHIHRQSGYIIWDTRDFYLPFYQFDWTNLMKERAEVEIAYTC